MFTYCPAEAIEADDAGRVPPVFVDVAPPHDFHDFFSKFLQNKRSGRRCRVYILSCRGY